MKYKPSGAAKRRREADAANAKRLGAARSEIADKVSNTSVYEPPKRSTTTATIPLWLEADVVKINNLREQERRDAAKRKRRQERTHERTHEPKLKH